VDVESIRDRVVSFYDEAPYAETAQAFIQGTADVLVALQDVFMVDMELGSVQRSATAFAQRLEWYGDALEGAGDDEDVVTFVLDPFLDGEYPEALEAVAPDWPDGETVWRLMNQLTGAIGNQVDEEVQEEVYEALRTAYEDAFRLFWTAVAGELERLLEQVPPGFTESMVDDVAAALDQAKDLAADPTPYITDPPAPMGTPGAIALGVLGIGALMIMSRRRAR
jgi:hypothetical protein